MSDKEKDMMNQDDNMETEAPVPFSSPSLDNWLNPSSDTREASQNTADGVVQSLSTGDLDSDADKDKSIIEQKDKGKRIKIEGSYDNKRDDILSSTSLIPPGISSKDLSSFHTGYERQQIGNESYADYIKQQQLALTWHERNRGSNIQVQLDPSGIPKNKDKDEDEDEDDDEDEDEEELKPLEELIFEIHIKEANRLVIPYKRAYRSFPRLADRDPTTEVSLRFTDPERRDWEMTLSYDTLTHSYVIGRGFSRYVEHYYLNPPDKILVYLPLELEQVHLNHYYIQHQKISGRYLFEMKVPKCNRLPIPKTQAGKFFNPAKAMSPPRHLKEYPLHLIDHLDRKWEMTFICYEEEQAYVVVRGWEKYAACYGVNPMDTLKFFEILHNTEQNSFVICHEPGQVTMQALPPPSCLQMKRICELDLTRGGVQYGRLDMPGVCISFQSRGLDLAKLSDMDNKNWYVMIRKVENGYIILDGWGCYLDDHKLETGDTVRLYYPEHANHDKHFLVECSKKNEEKKTEKEKVGVAQEAEKER